MCSIRTILFSVIYLVSGSIMFVGFSQIPPRPTVLVEGGQTLEQASAAADKQYNIDFQNSRSFVYIIAGVGGIVVNTVVFVLTRCLCPPRVAVAPMRLPTVRTLPAMPREVVIHELDPMPVPLPVITVVPQPRPVEPTQPQNWIEKAYLDNRPRRPATAYPHIL
jgi:hypothetical protein